MSDNLKPRIAFATCQDLGKLTPDDQLAADLLMKQNVIVETASWDDPEIRWQNYDAVILRSTWNYHRRLPQFLTWLESLDDADVRLWNPSNIVRANVSKKYLIDFQNAEIPIVPTVWIPRNKSTQLRSVLEEQNWDRVIIKPDVSASAYLTTNASISTATDDQRQLDVILKDSGALIQEFRNEIVEYGEWSLIFFEREFSHAVIKHPRAGDFRVQEELGGIIKAEAPPLLLINQAQKVLDHVNGPIVICTCRWNSCDR